jgi:suppressor for copper-sensitivity B
MPKLFIFLFVFMGLIPLVAQAGGTDWVSSDNAKARLITGVDTIGEKTTFEAAIELELNEGWHTYWQNPGDSGLPPRFEIEGSQNVSALDVIWPTPKRKREMDTFTVFTYEGRNTFPLKVMLKEPNADTTLNIALKYMACKDICVPDQIDLTMDLKAGKGLPAAFQSAIDLAKDKVPKLEQRAGLSIDTVVAGPEGMAISVTSKRGFENADVFAYAGDMGFTGEPKIVVDPADPQKAMITVSKPVETGDLSEVLGDKILHVIFMDGEDAVEKEIAF